MRQFQHDLEEYKDHVRHLFVRDGNSNLVHTMILIGMIVERLRMEHPLWFLKILSTKELTTPKAIDTWLQG